MKVKLMLYELYKVLFSYKVILLTIVILIIKTVVVCILPELRDYRINLSGNQYRRVLEELAGETSAEKEQYIFEMHQSYQSVLEKYNDNMNLYLSGRMDEKAWNEYSNEYSEALLYSNAYSIFNDKARDFASFREAYKLPLQGYFYDYGWNSIFTYMSFPDPILCIYAIILGIQFFCPEFSSGAIQIALTAKNGRRPWFISKLISILALLLSTALINMVIEIAVFSSRFYLEEGHWPLYSVDLYVSDPINLNLNQALMLLIIIRHIGFLLTGLLAFSIAGLTANTSHSVFALILLIFLPWLLIPDIPFTINAWLSGGVILKAGYGAASLIAPIVLVIITIWLTYYIRFYRRRN